MPNTFDPDTHLRLVADDYKSLRRHDVFRLLDDLESYDDCVDMARAVRRNRPDLAEEVDGVLWDIHDETLTE